jgi:hypothetical protein
MSENPKPLPSVNAEQLPSVNAVPVGDGFFVASPVLPANLNMGNIASWNATDDTVTLDWPKIEEAAERQSTWDHGLMRGIARMLLAAREVGRNEQAIAPAGFE